MPVEQQEDVCDLWTLDSLMETQVADRDFLHWKPLNSRNTNPRTEKPSKNRNQMEINPGNSTDFSFEKQQASTDLESRLLEDNVSTWIGSTERMRTNSKPLIGKCSDVPDLSPPSPVISLLSLDSCDLEIQMLIDADHPTQDSLQMDAVDSFDLYYSDKQDVQIYDPKCKTAEWTVHSDGDQNNNTDLSCLDSGFDMNNLTGSDGCFSPQEFDLQTNNVLENSNLDPDGQELNVQVSQRFHPDQVNYYTSQNNVPEDHFGQFAPCMMPNRKEAGYLATALSVSNQMDQIGSSHILDHHIFPELENQLEYQSKRIQNWEQGSGKSTNKSYSQSLEHLMSLDTNIRNADEIITQIRAGSALHGLIMDSSCFEGSYDTGESCSYSKFRGNSHNFEGVARSFPATVHKTHSDPIPTPPLDDDWLFSNIVAEVKNMTTDY